MGPSGNWVTGLRNVALVVRALQNLHSHASVTKYDLEGTKTEKPYVLPSVEMQLHPFRFSFWLFTEMSLGGNLHFLASWQDAAASA